MEIFSADMEGLTVSGTQAPGLQTLADWGLGCMKLTNLSIGVVNEEGLLNDELGMASGRSSPVGSSFELVDTNHYITLPFVAGTLEIFSADMEGLTVSET